MTASRIAASGQSLLQLLAQLVDHLPHPGALLRRKTAHAAQYFGQRAFFAHDADAEFFQILGRVQVFQFLQGLFPQGVEFLFHCVITCLSLLWGRPDGVRFSGGNKKVFAPEKGRRHSLRGTTLLFARSKHFCGR